MKRASLMWKAMALASSPKESNPTMAAFPRSLSSMAASIGGLAVFLVIASLLLVSYPIGSTVSGYFYGMDSTGQVDLPIFEDNQSSIDRGHDNDVDVVDKDSSSGSDLKVLISLGGVNNNSVNVSDSKPGSDLQESTTGARKEEESSFKDGSVALSFKENDVDKGSEERSSDAASADSKSGAKSDVSAVPSNASKTGSDDPGCDLYRGSWFYDSLGPLYTNNTCPVLTQMQNCQGNGRPDKEYENWRWKPSQCNLPRFDAKKFLELMRGKTIAFIGDSVARNQMESMLCLLWQVEAPKNQGNKKMQRYFFRSTSTMVVRIWSSWLVHQTSEPIDFAPEGVVKLHLDAPDEHFMEFIPSFDVIVLSSGHWFAKQSVYVLNNEIVGGQLWWPDKSRPMKINNIEAFGISVETILTSIATHPNYTGLTILRSYSPDHYEGGAWNTGGSCTGKEKPLAPGELVENSFTDIMHKKQIAGFDRAIKKATDKSKLKLMDITEAFGYRHDGHPGPYRSLDPNKLTKRGPDGKPPPQDCLHWCMPGPVDTWNELVLEIIRREFSSSQSSSV
ncbi:PREDICTED: protein trichome birefringence-like 18 [Populus euphratica]|uniref:Protein trichome birefringence-like 18 n=1 Tax=Populus euphratica TaxID=75702 RepID=A0AAJ6UHT4_POPEU|nr:PREDICTED: protein trichome birefringence-like 18 [Populus euphratica]XP_011029986.1 PREDICTED: protein trichome birefringence-like 18 [Populus euphratica]